MTRPESVTCSPSSLATAQEEVRECGDLLQPCSIQGNEIRGMLSSVGEQTMANSQSVSHVEFPQTTNLPREKETCRSRPLTQKEEGARQVHKTAGA